MYCKELTIEVMTAAVPKMPKTLALTHRPGSRGREREREKRYNKRCATAASISRRLTNVRGSNCPKLNRETTSEEPKSEPSRRI
jgi:hypothetical protein